VTVKSESFFFLNLKKGLTYWKR